MSWRDWFKKSSVPVQPIQIMPSASADTALREMISRHEGRKSKPYTDTVGKLTVGVGRNLTDVGLSESEIDLLLDNDIRRAVVFAKREIKCFDRLTVDRQHVLIDMAFNLGSRLLLFNRFLAALEQSDYETAAREMLASKWSGQVGQRAVELAEMMRRG